MHTIENVKKSFKRKIIFWSILIAIAISIPTGLFIAFGPSEGFAVSLPFSIMAICLSIICLIRYHKTYTYNGVTFDAFMSQGKNYVFMNGTLVEEFKSPWWQYTFNRRIGDDQVCIQFGPLNLRFFVRKNYYKNSK